MRRLKRYNIICLLLISILLFTSLISAYADNTFNERLQHIVYNSYDYTNKQDIQKDMYIYLPKNYSEQNKYNVLFMIPGSYFGASYWLCKPQLGIDAKEVIDKMIENNKCEPFIAVAIDGHRNQYECISESGQLLEELPSYIIPYIKDNYSVYDEPIHWGIIGYSNGAYLICSDVFPHSDLIKNFCLCGGCISSTSPITNNNIIYFTGGEYDISYFDLNILYQKLKDDNYCKINRISKCDHSWIEAIDGLKKSLPLFFKEDIKYAVLS